MFRHKFRFSWLYIFSPILGALLGHIMLITVPTLQKKNTSSSWKTSFKIDSEEESVFEKAIRTKTGVYAMPNQEIVYFVSSTDEEGKLLSSENRYKIEGITPSAPLWSITIYDQNYFLVSNSINKYHINGNNLKVKEGAPFSCIISNQESAENWLPAPKKGKFILCYRIYHPSLKELASPSFQLPRITKL